MQGALLHIKHDIYVFLVVYFCQFFRKKTGQASGPISNSQLSALLHVHLYPINHVVSMESHRDTLS